MQARRGIRHVAAVLVIEHAAFLHELGPRAAELGEVFDFDELVGFEVEELAGVFDELVVEDGKEIALALDGGDGVLELVGVVIIPAEVGVLRPVGVEPIGNEFVDLGVGGVEAHLGADADDVDAELVEGGLGAGEVAFEVAAEGDGAEPVERHHQPIFGQRFDDGLAAVGLGRGFQHIVADGGVGDFAELGVGGFELEARVFGAKAVDAGRGVFALIGCPRFRPSRAGCRTCRPGQSGAGRRGWIPGRGGP